MLGASFSRNSNVYVVRAVTVNGRTASFFEICVLLSPSPPRPGLLRRGYPGPDRFTQTDRRFTALKFVLRFVRNVSMIIIIIIIRRTPTIFPRIRSSRTAGQEKIFFSVFFFPSYIKAFRRKPVRIFRLLPPSLGRSVIVRPVTHRRVISTKFTR